MHIKAAHCAELIEHLRGAFHIRATVHQQKRRLVRWQDTGNRRAAHPTNALDKKRCACHQRTRAARGDERIAPALSQCFQADRHRGIPLLLRNARRRILHAHHIRRVEDFHSVEGNPTFLRAGLDFCLVAREEDGNPQLAHCRFAAFQNGKRRVIPAECVCNDFHPSDLLSICCAFSCRFIDGCLPPAAGRKELPVPG